MENSEQLNLQEVQSYKQYFERTNQLSIIETVCWHPGVTGGAPQIVEARYTNNCQTKHSPIIRVYTLYITEPNVWTLVDRVWMERDEVSTIHIKNLAGVFLQEYPTEQEERELNETMVTVGVEIAEEIHPISELSRGESIRLTNPLLPIHIKSNRDSIDVQVGIFPS